MNTSQAGDAAARPPPRHQGHQHQHPDHERRGQQPLPLHLVCYLRDGDRVFETYWTTRRGVEAMDYSWALMDLTVYGRQESWEDSPPGWPQQWQVSPSSTRTNGRSAVQWSGLEADRSDGLGTAGR
jgi:hypothetical protein